MAKQKVPRKETRTIRFSKEKIRKTERFSGRQDLLGALLIDGKEYTLEEAEAAIHNFMKGA